MKKAKDKDSIQCSGTFWNVLKESFERQIYASNPFKNKKSVIQSSFKKSLSLLTGDWAGDSQWLITLAYISYLLKKKMNVKFLISLASIRISCPKFLEF